MLYENGNTLGNHSGNTGAAKEFMSRVYGKESNPQADAYDNEAACERRERAKMAAMGIKPRSDGSCIKGSVAVMIFFGVIIVIIVTAIAVGGLLFGGL